MGTPQRSLIGSSQEALKDTSVGHPINSSPIYISSDDDGAESAYDSTAAEVESDPRNRQYTERGTGDPEHSQNMRAEIGTQSPRTNTKPRRGSYVMSRRSHDTFSDSAACGSMFPQPGIEVMFTNRHRADGHNDQAIDDDKSTTDSMGTVNTVNDPRYLAEVAAKRLMELADAAEKQRMACPQPQCMSPQWGTEGSFPASESPHHQPSVGVSTTQKEAMLAGRSYYPWDQLLVEDRERCSRACRRFSLLDQPGQDFRMIIEHPQQTWAAQSQIRSGRIGNNVAVEPPFACDYGYNISIGCNVIISRNCTINDVGRVTIGDNCFLGPNISIFTLLPTDFQNPRASHNPITAAEVKIGNGCWIGGAAIIFAGVSIGQGSRVLPGAVVTEDVLPNTRVIGNPAKEQMVELRPAFKFDFSFGTGRSN